MPVTRFKKVGRVLNSLLNDHFGVKPLSESQENIINWFNSDLGQRILDAEHKALNKIMPEIYGYHLMQLSVLNNIKLSTLSPVTHHFSIGLDQLSQSPAVANFEQLPINAESIDAAILHHVLEYSTNPHQLLRETARTIIPNGYVVIVGFNPIGLYGCKKNCGRILSRKAHWRHHNLHYKRCEDWLRLLDFEPVFMQYGYHGLPFDRGYRDAYDKFMAHVLPFTGTFYVIAARKSVIPMTLIKQPWNKTPAFTQWAKDSVVPVEPTVYNRESKD